MQQAELIVHEVPYAVNEEIKYLRTGIQFSGVDKKVILITSAISGEGKSTISLLLAKSLTEIGKRVLLIDSDMRKSHLNREVKNRHEVTLGLSHFLSGQNKLPEVLITTDVDNLFMVIAGPVPPNPSELLASDNMQKLVDWGKAQFDYIIVDTAPVGTVVDAAVVAQYCDAGAMVLEAGKVPYKMAQSVKHQLENAHCPILGVILNKVETKSGKKYYNRYYSRYYRKYSEYTSKNEK